MNVETSPVKQKERKKCRKCSKVFSSIPLLNKHMLNHHEEICKICERKFLSSDLLKEHIKIHEEQSPSNELLDTDKKLEISVTPHLIVKCELCDSSFDTLEILRQHTESEHSEVHKCAECDKIFTTKDEMSNHSLEIHSQIDSIIGHSSNDKIELEECHNCSSKTQDIKVLNKKIKDFEKEEAKLLEIIKEQVLQCRKNATAPV